MSSSGLSPPRALMPRLARGVTVAAVASVAAVVAVLVLDTHSPSPAPAATPPGSVAAGPVDARVTLAAGSPVVVLSSFLGVSTEYWTVPVWA